MTEAEVYSTEDSTDERDYWEAYVQAEEERARYVIEKADKLAEALRENRRRLKAQARARAALAEHEGSNG